MDENRLCVCERDKKKSERDRQRDENSGDELILILSVFFSFLINSNHLYLPKTKEKIITHISIDYDICSRFSSIENDFAKCFLREIIFFYPFHEFFFNRVSFLIFEWYNALRCYSG